VETGRPFRIPLFTAKYTPIRRARWSGRNATGSCELNPGVRRGTQDPTRSQCAGLFADFGVMTDVHALDEEEDILGDIRGVI
jgi:hypothetical protein